MSFKLILSYICIILDVVLFPFSCSNNRPNNEFIFVIEIDDQVNEVFYYNQFVQEIPENEIIDFPEDWEFDLPQDYQITEWRILGADHIPLTDRTIVFPFEITEGDRISYFKGHRSCVVFEAVWECLSYAGD